MADPTDSSSGSPTPETPTPLPSLVPKISNIVCGANLNCRLDLKTIATHARNVIYTPKRFPAAIMRLRSPKATGLVFANGKLQVLGIKSVDDAKLAVRKFARTLQKLGFQARPDQFNVQNIVANVDTKMLIRLEGLQYAQPEFCKFEPEFFPGLVYTILKPRMKALVFAKGKVVFLGAKSRREVDKAAELLHPVLLQFRRT